MTCVAPERDGSTGAARLDHGEDRLRRGDTRCAGMKLRGNLSQRRISLGRKDQHDQAGAEIDRPVQQP